MHNSRLLFENLLVMLFIVLVIMVKDGEIWKFDKGAWDLSTRSKQLGINRAFSDWYMMGKTNIPYAVTDTRPSPSRTI